MGSDTLAIAWLGSVPYEAALGLQEGLLAARQAGAIGDLLLLLEHPHVYTMGRGASERYLIAPPADIPLYRVSRGGQVTYHGPGQLIGYPIIALDGAARDVHAYMRNLEQTLIDALAGFGIGAGRRAGLTGVWIDDRKIASIGVGIRRWVTMHGFALNVCPDLSFFGAIVPCGIEDCRMTSIANEGLAADLHEATMAVGAAFASVFGYPASHAIAAEEIWPYAAGSAPLEDIRELR